MTAPDYYRVTPSNPIHNPPSRIGGPLSTPKTWQEMQATTQFLLDTFIGQIAIAFGGIEIFGWKPFDFLVEWGQQRIADAAAALSAANYANSQLGVLAVTAFAGAVPGGVALSEPFNGASANDLGSSFTRTSSGSGAGGYGPNGSGWATWKKSGGLDRTHVDRHNTPLATNYQVVIVVLASAVQQPLLGGNAYNYFGGRINSALDSFVYARIGWNDLQLGCYVSGSETVFDNIAFTPRPGDEIRLYLGTFTDVREFLVTRNGETLIDYTDSSAVSQYGVGYLYAGLAETAANRASEFGLFLFSDQTVPASLDAWAASDRLPASI